MHQAQGVTSSVQRNDKPVTYASNRYQDMVEKVIETPPQPSDEFSVAKSMTDKCQSTMKSESETKLSPSIVQSTIVDSRQNSGSGSEKKSFKQYISGSHSKREWLLLGERVFSHPRYAFIVVVALGLCVFERYWFVMFPLALFFTLEWSMRFWLQKEEGYRNRTEMVFLLLDGLATLSMYFALMMPADVLGQGIYLRIVRLFRGMYLLRMLRIFRFLTHDTFVFSLPFSLVIVASAALAWAISSIALYIGIILIFETSYRAYSLYRILPQSKRRTVEFSFIFLDLIATITLLGVVPELSSAWVFLRLIRFLLMLNPLGNILLAIKKVMLLQEVRQEVSMLAGMFLALMTVGFVAIWYVYPQLDLNDDGSSSQAEYTPIQVLHFVFRLVVDPGAAPAESFSPWLSGLTAILVLAGVFFFALTVSLGSNIMKFMLRELANSSLSAREHLLFVGWNDQALPILRKVGQFCARMRHSIPSVWFFYEKTHDGADQVGNWLSVREVESGSRDLIQRFKLTGVSQMVLFMQKQYEPSVNHTADLHHLIRELGADTMMITDSPLPKSLSQVYKSSLQMQVVDSASVRARMLYQMHHCSYMPDLGVHMLDVVAGDTGLYALDWSFEVVSCTAGAKIKHGSNSMLLEAWISNSFGEGLNLLAALREDGTHILFSDLMLHAKDESFDSLVALGRDELLWPGILNQGFSLGDSTHLNQLQAFTWQETWDLSMMFLGWHPGLPSMIEEMAESHHKLTCHVFSTCDETRLVMQMRGLREVEEKVNAIGRCKLKVSVHAWNGLDTEVLTSQLRGCKVMMLYPEIQAEGNEDSMLELWLHEVGSMLTTRKEKVKWWTPPKLMALPRSSENIESLIEVSHDYPLLDIRVGSPDTFQDVFMARQLLTQAGQRQYPEQANKDAQVYGFMDAMLGDAVLVEDVDSSRLFEEGIEVSWQSVHREALRRGWTLMGYLKHDHLDEQVTAFSLLDQSFPLNSGHVGNMQLLAGSPVTEMDAPLQTASLLFCRRGVLSKDEEVSSGVNTQINEGVKVVEEPTHPETTVKQPSTVEIEEKAEKVVEKVAEAMPKALAEADNEHAVEVTEVAQQQEELTTLQPMQETAAVVRQEQVVEGEVMSEAVWPTQADKRLIRVLQKQVEGSVDLLSSSSEDGLVKLMEILDMGVSSEVEAKIMEALTDLQNIDRVSQRLNNVKTCLSDWAEAQPDSTGQALWQEEMLKRYVMEEERIVLRGEL